MFVKNGLMRKCRHCTVPFEVNSPSQRFCEGCVRGETNAKMRQRQNIALYGVDQDMYEAMYFEQDGTCPICLVREAICVDHCHESGEARGLLCLGCNTALGFIESDKMGRALDYLSTAASAAGNSWWQN